MNSPQSQKLTVGSIVDKYVKEAIIKTTIEMQLLILLNKGLFNSMLELILNIKGKYTILFFITKFATNFVQENTSRQARWQRMIGKAG